MKRIRRIQTRVEIAIVLISSSFSIKTWIFGKNCYKNITNISFHHLTRCALFEILSPFQFCFNIFHNLKIRFH